MVVRIGGGFPDHLNRVGVDGAVGQFLFPDLEVECAHLVGTGFNQANGAAVVAAETHPRKHVFRRFAERFANIEFRHQAAGGRALGAEGEGLAADIVRQLIGGHQAGRGVGDEVGHKGLVLNALGKRPGTGYQATGLHAGQATKPRQLDLVVAEGRHRRRIGFHRDVADIHVQLAFQVLRNAAEALDQLGLVFIRNGGEHKRLRQGSGERGCNEESGKREFPYQFE